MCESNDNININKLSASGDEEFQRSSNESDGEADGSNSDVISNKAEMMCPTFQIKYQMEK